MLTVSQQIKNYRAMKALEARQGKHAPVRANSPIVLYTHPKTKDFFRTLMQRWHKTQPHQHAMAQSKR